MHNRNVVALLALGLLAACGRGSGADAQAQSSAQPETPAPAQAAVDKPGLFASPQKDCEAPKHQPSKTREDATRVIDGCLAVLAKNADEDGESAWNQGQVAAAEKGDPTAQFLSAMAALVHPDGRLRNAQGMERVQALQRFNAAATGGYVLEIYELAKRWGRDRRRSETAEDQNAMYLGEDLFRLASMHGVHAATLEVARLHIYFALGDEKTFNYESARDNYYQARRLLETVRTKGDAKEKRSAELLLKELPS